MSKSLTIFVNITPIEKQNYKNIIIIHTPFPQISSIFIKIHLIIAGNTHFEVYKMEGKQEI